MGWGVWVHHMFATGLGPVAISAFSVSTMFIAVPTGVKIFNWIGTMWNGSLRFTVAMKFAIGFIAMFTIGGLSGVTHALSPHDRQQTDTYYVVAHFHYVLFGGALFGIMAGVYYWYPKVFGKLLSERIGNWHFWLWLIGFNMTFAPFHILGLQGMPRRIYTYPRNFGFEFWNLFATIGAFVIAASVLVFLFNVRWTKRHGAPAPADPWDGRTLEWTLPSPPPEHNFDEVPIVHSVDDFWHRKYTEDENGRLVKLEQPGGPEAALDESAEGADAGGHDEHGDHGGGHGIHLPSPSFFPLVASFGLPIIGYGMIYRTFFVSAIGGLVVLAGVYAWALEPSVEPEDPGDHPPAAIEEPPSGEPAMIGAVPSDDAPDGEGS
jgi:cytochrome c oxidase subunit 1